MKGIEYVKVGRAITTEELFQMIKGCRFSAGVPEYKTEGPMKRRIKLPAVGRYCIQLIAGGNRVQLTVVNDREQKEKYAFNFILSRLLGFFANIFDKDKKPSYELMQKTAEELKGYIAGK
jgi:hypothetical protein